jgi:hypothetical protein
MTPEGIEAARGRASNVPARRWTVERGSGDIFEIVRAEFPRWTDAVIPNDADHMGAVADFLANSITDVRGLLAHADALQARLDAVEAERDQLRAIFERDVLTDSEAMRLAYERGKADVMKNVMAVRLP